MRSILSKTEAVLLLAFTALLGVALFAPAMAQSAHQHAFADTRTLGGVLYAMDVLSNLPFALMALAGFWLLWRLPARSVSNMQRAMALLFFGSLLLVAVGSGAYHLDPHDATLALDRYCMALAFAGLLGLATAGQVSERAGATLGLGLLALAPLAVYSWSITGNVMPWAVLQFGGMALLWWLAMLRRREGALRIDWALVLLAYGAAKLLEVNDHAIYHLSGEMISGHSLKHVVAALAAWPVLVGLARHAAPRQNATPLIIADEVAIRWWRNA